MKKTVVSLQNMEGWPPLIRSRKVWLMPTGLPGSGVTTLSDRLESLGFMRYGPEVMDTIRAQGRVLRPGNLGYVPALTDANWEGILGPLQEPVKKGASIVIDAPHVERLDRELLTCVATWWGYLVLRVLLNIPPETCLKRMATRERLGPKASPEDQLRIAEVSRRLANDLNSPRASEGRWLILEGADPLDNVFELTVI